MHKRLSSSQLVGILLCLLFSSTTGCKGRMTSPKPPPNLYKITASSLHGVTTVGTNHIWMVGAYGTVYHSLDEGRTWSRQNSGTDNLLTSVNFIDENTGWITGIYGTLLHTDNGGTTWVSQNSVINEHLFSICFLNKNSGWAVGSMGTILHTPDGGKTWASQHEREDVNLNGVSFVDEKNGWIVGEFGTILHTSDGGKTWVEQKPKTLFAQKDDPWADVPLALYGVKFIDQSRGWVVGMEGVLLRTEDGGKTWMDLRSTYTVKTPFYAVEIKGNHGWIVGEAGRYLLSEDGGKNWKVIENMIKTRFWLHGVSFNTPEKGWIVGARGAVVKTEDGGRTWTMLSGLTYDVPEYGLTDF